jgi:hypothetical protein
VLEGIVPQERMPLCATSHPIVCHAL